MIYLKTALKFVFGLPLLLVTAIGLLLLALLERIFSFDDRGIL